MVLNGRPQLWWAQAPAGSAKETDMGIPETKRTGGCTCRCNVCKTSVHCRNVGNGCRVKL
jgi:hypothetical protein